MNHEDYLFELFLELGLSDFAARTAQFAVSIALVVLVAAIVSRVGGRVARRAVESLVARSALPGAPARSRGRAATLGGVLANIIRIVVWFIAGLLVLGQFDVNLGPLLAGASVVGVAVGFGAQSLVRDFLSGFFVLAEDQFGVGDVITVADITGTVEELNLRVTRLRSVEGTVWFVPNGEIRKVGNAAREWSRAIVDIVVPPGTDLNQVTRAMSEEIARWASDPAWASAVLEAPEVLGVENMDADGSTVRVTAKTPPEERARVARELRARIGARLHRDGLVPTSEPSTPLPAGSDGTAGDDERR